MLCILIWVVVTQVYKFIKTHQTVTESLHFNACKLYCNLKTFLKNGKKNPFKKQILRLRPLGNLILYVQARPRNLDL